MNLRRRRPGATGEPSSLSICILVESITAHHSLQWTFNKPRRFET
jgi:hypothetical protein